VAEIVDGCSDADTRPKPPWRQRKDAYVAHLRDDATPSMRLISACDKLHNARAILLEYRRLGRSLWQHFKGGRDGTLWYYRAVVEALQAHGTTPLVEELDRVVTELETLVGG
jgi:GTP pyrophosphokinase